MTRARDSYAARLDAGLALLAAVPLSDARRRANITWAELGALVGVSSTTIRSRMAAWTDTPCWPGVAALAVWVGSVGEDWPELAGAAVRAGLRDSAALLATGWPSCKTTATPDNGECV